MLTDKQLNSLHEIVKHIEEGYGWVAEDMMQIYARDEELGSWADVEEYMDRWYDHFKVYGEKVWDITGVGKTRIRKEYKD